MNNVKKIALCMGLFLSFGAVGHLSYKEGVRTAENRLKTDTIYVDRHHYYSNNVKWHDFISALIQVESGGKWNVVGSADDVGVLQITPICLYEANRILGYDKYKLEDRLDSIKSVEIFNIIQEYHNPNKDMHFALKLWNPYAPIEYHTKVMNELNKK